MSTTDVLTDNGWPRPRMGGWPIPWVSPAADLSEMDPARYNACASGAVCAVCGDGYPAGADAYALALTDRVDPLTDLSDGVLRPMDNAVMHERCLRLALAWCPELARKHAAGALVCVRVPANAAVVEPNEDGDGVRGVIDGARCEVVPMPPVGTRR